MEENLKQKSTQINSDFTKAQELGFNSNDFIRITKRNINLETVSNQFQLLINGLPNINIDRPAILNDGIEPLSEEQAKYFATIFDGKKKNIKIKKFVPASGAASRMFKFLTEFINEYKPEEETINAYINRKKDKNLPIFLVAKEKFAFYDAVLESAKKLLPNFETCSKDEQDYAFINAMLSPSHYNFANKPKGVLPFHKYANNHIATAIEEHLNECVSYACSNNESHLHFTVSEEHQGGFEEIINKIISKFESQNSISINVNYSYQDKATDVIAVDLDGNPFRDDNDQLVFRPGGHGALIENLNTLQADVIFIKNIDNVIQNHIQEVALYKKALAGKLTLLQESIFEYLKILDSGLISENNLLEIVQFSTANLKISITEDFSKYTKESKIEYLHTLLNRPIRVCGMVKNEGEPGGGPFWVRDVKGNTYLQIIEASQIDANQTKILEKSTHFNPVDLVCSTKNFKGEYFDLTQYIDANTGFIVEKNNNGKLLKAYELPGLWNGAMANWITVFVEVPLFTFNPVKTVNDLLKPAHQSVNG
jgi:HD-GYP domain-containing protein (c-di-GMP phosphodiesterase class II)